MATTITLKTKKPATAKVSNKVEQPAMIDKALENAIRAAYSQTYYADPVLQQGDAVCTLSPEYITQVVNHVRAQNANVPITAATFSIKDGAWEHEIAGIVLAAVSEAESNQANQQDTSPDLSPTEIRSSAAAAAMVMNNDAEINDVLSRVVISEHTRRTAPALLAFRLKNDFVRFADDGTLLCNMIEGTGPEFDGNAYSPWPAIGTKETDKDGKKINNNPDISKVKSTENKSGFVEVSWYYQAICMSTEGKKFAALIKEYHAAANENPSGRFADKHSPDYLGRGAASKEAIRCKSALQDMTKALKKATMILRHMWSVDEMAPEGQPPRCTARFDVAHTWDVKEQCWNDDETKLMESAAPIIVTDNVSRETERFDVNRFLGMDTYTAGINGGSMSDLLKAVGKAKIKRTPGSGTGQTPQSPINEKATAMTMDETSTAFARMATTVETTAAWANYERYLSTADHDDALQSTWRILVAVQAMFQTKPDFRARIVKLEKMKAESVDDIAGLGPKTVAPAAGGTREKLILASKRA
ncbi:MAG TPA: hypothetical protein VGJ00_04120 [Rhabdochlamydiaceae bacterium]